VLLNFAQEKKKKAKQNSEPISAVVKLVEPSLYPRKKKEKKKKRFSLESQESHCKGSVLKLEDCLAAAYLDSLVSKIENLTVVLKESIAVRVSLVSSTSSPCCNDNLLRIAILHNTLHG
jgi:hypothetical protein